jgi:U3 small nucleolar RNA-associated protein 19
MRILFLDSTYLGPRGPSEPVVSKATIGKIILGVLKSSSTEAAKELAVSFVSDYDDLRYYFYSVLPAVLLSEDLAASKETAQRVLDLLLDVSNFVAKDNDIRTFYMKEKPYVSKTAKKADGDPLLHSSHKVAFEKAWLAFLRMPLSVAQYKNVLNVLHQKVMPYMARPQLLMDFLTDSYDVGGSISLLALNGLFQLMQSYNLDYPDFYTKLYALLEPSVMHVKYRARFFRLVDLFLSSTHLPATIAASFIKRISRLALFGPPGSVVIAVPFVYNQLKRHPTCMSMIQNVDVATGQPDPFNESEPDPLLTDALKSSLWELETLQSHYHPNVATLARILSQPFNKPRYDLEDFLHHSYKTLAEAERTRRIKGPPPALEFEEFPSVFGNTGSQAYLVGWTL